MAKRQSTTIHIDASKIQGEGAFIELRKFNYAERRAWTESTRTLPEPTVDSVGWNRGITPLLDEALRSHLVDWNLVDEKGQPIPVGDLGVLVDGEIEFVFAQIQALIMRALGTDEATEKN